MWPNRAKGLLWLVGKITPLTSLTRKSLSWNEKLQRKLNWTARSINLKENAGKVKSDFVIRVALWAEKLGHCVEKNVLGKLAVAVNTEGHSIRILNERSEKADSGSSCPLRLLILKSVWYSVGYTICLRLRIQLAVSCSELYFVGFCALKWTGTFVLESKVMCLF